MHRPHQIGPAWRQALTRQLSLLLLLATTLVVSEPPRASAFGVGDLKKKAEKEAKKAIAKKETADTPANADSTSSAAESAPAPEGGSISQVSTKFDFVPGDLVLFADDFSADESGDFPARWKLLSGNLDVVEFEGRKWLRLAGYEGQFQMKLNGPLPERWTLEFDLHTVKAAGILSITPVKSGSREPWWVVFGPNGNDVHVMANGRESSSPLPGFSFVGHHHIALMAQGLGLKVYVDRERVVNQPEIAGALTPENLTFRMRYQASVPLITNVRFAEKSLPKPDLLADGPFVTHGITFESGSDKVRPESAPVLREVTKYLNEHGAVRVKISGHTDDVGTDAANLDLSQRRAAAVKAVLASEFGIDENRLETEGKGESSPAVKGTSPEDRATNRRVEFVRIG